MMMKLKLHPLGQNPKRDQRLGYISDATKVQSIIDFQMSGSTNFRIGGRPMIRIKGILKVIKAI